MDNQRHLKVLELDKVLALCAEYAVSDAAKARILEILPESDYSSALHQLSLTKAADDLSVHQGNPGFYQLVPCKDNLARAERGGTLSPQELLDIAAILRAARSLTKWYKEAAEGKTQLDPLFEALNPNSSLEKEISRCIISHEEIADNASAQLSDMRRKIRNANQKARETLEKIVRSSTYQKYLQEQIITIRNGRFVVPVRSEHRNEIKGLVHDTSASGSTLFIEPMTVVELNNQIKELEVAQREEIKRILASLSAMAADDRENILSNYDVIVQLDVIFAKVKLGDKMKAFHPVLAEGGETRLDDARHPLIDPQKVVPISITVGGEFDTLVITGPNTGGKTVALKTLGLLTLMALCGFMIPASSRSKVAFRSKILADIGDEQSIEQSLSTFSGHMTNIISILKEADESSLILIDELGAGTDPVEGAALAVAIIDELRRKKPHIVATTHYAEMKMYALQTPGVENASCEFDVKTLRPTYRLIIGTPGRSNAFAISERLGMPKSIIEEAELLVSSEDHRFEEVVSNLEETRLELEMEKRQAQNLRQQAASAKQIATEESQALKEQQEKLLEEARSRSRTILERVRFQADQVLDELEMLKKQKDKENFSASFSSAQGRIRGILDDMEDTANPVIKKQSDYKLPRKLVSGDTVFLIDFNTEGTVINPPDNRGNLRVQAGIIDTKVSVDRVRLVNKPKTTVKLSGGHIRTKRSGNSGSAKLDIRGLDSEEAKLELKRFIDQSSLHKLKTVTIVHGKGTGVLRETVSQQLHMNKLVDSYRLGDYGEGGDGVTIAELK